MSRLPRLDQAIIGIALGATAAGVFILGVDSDPDLTPTTSRHISVTPAPTPTADTSIDESVIVADEVIDEDDPRWNCLVNGNGICGPDWLPVPEDMADALAEGEEFGMPPVKWETCLYLPGDTTYVVCPDGTVVTS